MGQRRGVVNGTANTWDTILIAQWVHWAFPASNWTRCQIWQSRVHGIPCTVSGWDRGLESERLKSQAHITSLTLGFYAWISQDFCGEDQVQRHRTTNRHSVWHGACWSPCSLPLSLESCWGLSTGGSRGMERHQYRVRSINFLGLGLHWTFPILLGWPKSPLRFFSVQRF